MFLCFSKFYLSRDFAIFTAFFFQQEMAHSNLTNLPKRRNTSTASPSSLRITPWNFSHSIDFKDNHNHSKRIIDISAFLSYILHNCTTNSHACKRLLLNIFLNDHLVFEEDHGVEEEGSKDRDDANEGPQLQGGHGWAILFSVDFTFYLVLLLLVLYSQEKKFVSSIKKPPLLQMTWEKN